MLIFSLKRLGSFKASKHFTLKESDPKNAMGAKVGVIQLGTALIPALPGPSAYGRLNPGGRGRRRIRGLGSGLLGSPRVAPGKCPSKGAALPTLPHPTFPFVHGSESACSSCSHQELFSFPRPNPCSSSPFSLKNLTPSLLISIVYLNTRLFYCPHFSSLFYLNFSLRASRPPCDDVCVWGLLHPPSLLCSAGGRPAGNEPREGPS